MSALNLIKSRPLEILSVEDNPADIYLIRQFLCGTETPCHLTFVNDGEAAMNYLFQRGEFFEAKRPDLILLDLNLPRMDGKEVLRTIKADPGLQIIPTLILTSSKADLDIQATYREAANCYYVKPSDLTKFVEVMGVIRVAWIQSARLPLEHSAA